MAQFKEPCNLIISGVGGQGNILASGLTSLAATAAGYQVVVGETYGASQRGGSVMSHVRLSRENDYGPLIPSGRADFIIGFEPLETLRVAAKYAHQDTVAIVNITPVYPVSVILNEADYPAVEDIIAGIKSLTGKVFTLNATDLAREAGDPRVLNIVMVNALAETPGLPLQRSHFQQALQDFLISISPEQRETNKKAFELKLELMEV